MMWRSRCPGIVRESLSLRYRRKNQTGIRQDIEEKILPAAKEWQQRPLDAIYAVGCLFYFTDSNTNLHKKSHCFLQCDF